MKTFKTDGPGPDDLVPSRYAVRVGEIDVLVISDGVLEPPAESMATNAEPAIRNAWLDRSFLAHDTFDWALNAVVVRSGTQTILIDSGIGGEVPDFTRAGLFGNRLAAAGVDLAAVTDVVLTHMHFDHVGGLLVEGVKEQLRPDLRIHVSTAEVAFWKAPDFSRTGMPPALAEIARNASRRFLDMYQAELRTFEQEQQVAPGVVVARTGGHTPGHSVVRVASGSDRLMFGGDAIFPVSFDHPEWHNGFEHDPEEATRVRLRLMQELATTGSWLVSTHMPFPSVGRVGRKGSSFAGCPPGGTTSGCSGCCQPESRQRHSVEDLDNPRGCTEIAPTTHPQWSQPIVAHVAEVRWLHRPVNADLTVADRRQSS